MMFRHKPTKVAAEQFWADVPPLPFSPDPVVFFENGEFKVETIHGDKLVVENGDWIVREIEPVGYFHAYPCKPAVFVDSYEPDARPNTLVDFIYGLLDCISYIENIILAPDKVKDAMEGKQFAVNVLRGWLRSRQG